MIVSLPNSFLEQKWTLFSKTFKGFEFAGSWDVNGPKKIKMDFFSGALDGRKVRATTFHYPPNTYIKEGKNGSKEFSGLEVKVFKAIVEALKLDFVIETPSDGGKWGREDFKRCV